MSLNHLPDELIAHVGSFLNFKDNQQFALSQKRIERILKRYELDKPECFSLFIDFPAKLKWIKFDKTNRDYPVVEDIRKAQNESMISCVRNIISQFRRISELELHEFHPLTKDVFRELLTSKTNIDLLTIGGGEVNFVDPTIIIAVCKKFKTKIDFLAGLSSIFYRDEVFLQILPTTILNPYEFTPKDGSGLTDRVLLAIASFPTPPIYFEIDYVYTSFTVRGIKEMVQVMLDSPLANIRYDLGLLKSNEELNANLWKEEVSHADKCKYSIHRIDAPDVHEYLVYYSIYFKQNVPNIKSSIRFAVSRNYI